MISKPYDSLPRDRFWDTERKLRARKTGFKKVRQLINLHSSKPFALMPPRDSLRGGKTQPSTIDEVREPALENVAIEAVGVQVRHAVNFHKKLFHLVVL